MNNLEKMIKDKEYFKQQVVLNESNALTEAEKDHKNKIKKLEKDYEKTLDEIKNETAVTVGKYDLEFKPLLVKALITDLNSDFDAMQARELYSNISQETINKVVSINKSISKLKDKNDIDNIVDNLVHLVPELKGLKNFQDIEDLKKPREITTYVSSNGIACYILAPIIEKYSESLIKEFEKRLFEVVDFGDATIRKDNVLKHIKFKGDLEYHQNFLTVTIPTNETKELLYAMIAKLNAENIQPKSFKGHNLKSVAKCLDYEILKDFMNYSSEQETSEKQKRHYKKREPIDKIQSESVEAQSYLKIYKGYEDASKVITDYNTLNDLFHKEKNIDMKLSDIQKYKVEGISIKGFNLYCSLIVHVQNGTIQPDQIHIRSNLTKYQQNPSDKNFL